MAGMGQVCVNEMVPFGPEDWLMQERGCEMTAYPCARSSAKACRGDQPRCNGCNIFQAVRDFTVFPTCSLLSQTVHYHSLTKTCSSATLYTTVALSTHLQIPTLFRG